MESATKNRQPAHVLRSLIARAYGEASVPDGEEVAEELTQGWFNVAYRIRLRDGRQVVLKIAPPAGVEVLTRERGMMRTELAAMELVATRTGVPVPRVDFSDTSHELVDADYFFMEFVDSDNFGSASEEGRLSVAEIAAGNRELGRLNREITSVVGPHFGPLVGEGFTTWRDAFTAVVEDTLADGIRAGVDLGWDEDEVRGVLAEHADALDEVTVPRLIEVDLWTKNSMIRDGRIVAILDHERAMFGDPLMEAGLTGIDFPDFGDPTDFMAGFGIGELDEPARIRRRLYSLHLALIMTVETAYRHYPTSEIYDFGRRHLDLIMAALGRTR